MPVLDWIGKQAVVNHHLEVPYRLLEGHDDLSVGEEGTGNLLVEGDNLEALKALLPHYAGQVKCIYIDPPYNTGKEKWVYNDNVNAPEIRRWLGKVVGGEADDMSRHDKWLCMMYPRLKLLWEFLHREGLLLVSIDDIEFARLRLVLDDICGGRNLLAVFAWRTEGNFDNQAKVKVCHEYILAYCKDIGSFPEPTVIDPNVSVQSKLRRPEIINTIVKNGPKNPKSYIQLPVGFPAAFDRGVVRARDNAWPHYEEDVLVEDGRVRNTVRAFSGWSSKRIFERFVASGFEPVADTKGKETTFHLSSTGAIEAVKRRAGGEQGHVVSVLHEVGTTNQSRILLKKMGLAFTYPKPVELVRYLISLVRDTRAIVLDSFAGSGTTGQAVLEANRAAGNRGQRRFILVELEPSIARETTRERLRCVVDGCHYTTGKKGNVAVPGTGGGFRYCTLGPTLFDEMGRINPEVTFADLARHVWFAETREPLLGQIRGDTPLLGTHRDTAYYLLYNGVLKDRRPGGGNVLTRAVLESLPAHDGRRVVYGVGCRLGADRLRAAGVVFRHIPYEVEGGR